MWRCSTARGLSTGLFLVGLAKVKAGKSILFSKVTPKVEKEHLSLIASSASLGSV